MRPDDDREVGEIARAEQALYRAMIAQDFERLDALLAEDLAFIHSTAVLESKEQYLRGVAQGLYEYAAIESRGATTRCQGDLALQTGTVEMSVGERGAPKQQISLIVTLAWRREAGGRRLALRQATRRPE
jgi:ketosteroid isomerase-like protein